MSTCLEILPSVLAADFAHLARDLERLEQAGARGWHLDVMDGHFVPNITMGPAFVEAVRRSSTQLIDLHLMIYNPYDWIERFVAAGAQRITFHLEATEDVEATIDFIRTCGCQVGLAVSPQTSVHLLDPFLAKIDLALIMTVNPGFGGQNFMEPMLEKVEYLARMREQYQLVQASNPQQALLIQVDGGIDASSGLRARAAGANSLVAGTYLFKSEDPADAIALLRQ